MKYSDVSWPDITFGPVNLWTVEPAWWFYMSSEEKINEYAKNYDTYIKEERKNDSL